jgi:hypothetical protein
MHTLITNHPIALTSPDHLRPYGIKENNSSNPLFNAKLYQLAGRKKLKICDVGCAGGGFVNSVLSDGHFAVGIDGSDYAKLHNLGCWGYLPNNLFTADATKPFYFIDDDKKRIKFNYISFFDVLEHFTQEDLSGVLNNIIDNLLEDGAVICSINTASAAHVEVIEKQGSCGRGKHHQNVKPPEYWDQTFADHGFVNNREKLDYFEGQFIRGPGHGCDPLATEARYNLPNLPIEQQWATILRFYERGR